MAVFTTLGSLLRRRSDRPWIYAAWAASTAATLLLTLWVKTGATGEMSCIVSRDLWEPLRVTQGRMNILMFVPIGFFGVLAVRRMVPALAAPVLLSCGVEGLQALVPGIGRYCDTSDLVANVLGAASGVVLGAFSMRALAGSPPSWGLWRLRHMIVMGAACTGTVCLMASVVDLRVVDHAEPTRAGSAEQRAALTRVVQEALGDEFRITDVLDWTPCGVDGVDEEIWTALQPAGQAEMSWPDQNMVHIDLPGRITSLTTPPSGYPIAGASEPVSSAAAARRVAGIYVSRRFRAGTDTTRPRVEEPESESAETWTVVYPYRAVGMPAIRSLRVGLNRAGRLRDIRLSGTSAGDGPAVRVDKEKSREGRTCG
ncbi:MULTISPECIES: VanZ family protein [unclassified Streptomyces]|uniref:VanZ family protein n=1 Tax=unclassified Streptomyces TaxID=2593676 RepID=UPI002E2FC52F|nr:MULTISPECIES: VanZ family protein [unclassified Streptomyces]